MKFEARVTAPDMPKYLTRYASRHAQFALGKLSHRLSSVSLQVRKLGRDDRGFMHECHLRTTGDRLTPIAVTTRAEDPREAIDLACARMERALRSTFDRGRTRVRSGITAGLPLAATGT